MIEASIRASVFAGLTRQLETRAQELGEQRARTLAKSARTHGHRWRSSSTLWPDIT